MELSFKSTLVVTALIGTLLCQNGCARVQKADSKSPTAQMIPVGRGVSLEVLDWGGTGHALVLLTGLADDAHIFDQFAPKLTAKYHVYGISRRGRGASSKPEANETNYTASQVGDDALAVIDALHLNKPVIAGHSIAGEELSYIGSQHPDKVAGLIYMEAAYPYGLYDQVNGNLGLDAIALRKELVQFTTGYDYEPVRDYKAVLADLDRVEKEIERHEQATKDLPPTPVSPRMTPDLFAILESRERFTAIQVPALVIFGVDPSPASGTDPQALALAARQALMTDAKTAQIAAVKRQMPSAQVVLIPRASHYVFQSNEAQVLHVMNEFIATLPLGKT